MDWIGSDRDNPVILFTIGLLTILAQTKKKEPLFVFVFLKLSKTLCSIL